MESPGRKATDDRGKVLHIYAFKSDVSVPKVAQLEAILKALQLAKSFEWLNVQIESDALVVIQALKMKVISPLHWAAEPFFKDI